MKKKLFALLVFLLLTTIGFVSSQGFGELLGGIDETTIMLFGIFIIAFSLLFFALNKVFKGNTSVSGIISVVIAFFIVYGINKSGLDVQGSLSNIGIPREALGVIIPLVIVAGIIFLIIKLKKNSLLAIGGLLILISFFVYEKIFLITAGVVLIIIRIFLESKILKGGGMSLREATRYDKDAGSGI